MDQTIFQQKLKDLVILGSQNKKQLHREVIESFFQEDGLRADQLDLVFDYLRSQGIRVMGASPSPSSLPPLSSGENPGELAALSPEDERTLKEYRELFSSRPALTPGEKEQLFRDAREGAANARQKLAEAYLPLIVELSCAFPSAISLQDKIQEGSLGLWMALEKDLPAENPEEYLRTAVSESISSLLASENRQKQEDNYLVERVRSLEARVRELTEDEEIKYSVEELSAFLDMDAEEIQDILKLTGEN